MVSNVYNSLPLPLLIKFDFIDTDALIEQKTGVDIPTIFEHEGEKGFRDRESKVLREISNIRDTVIGTGGGIIIFKENREIIKKLGFIVYLTASIRELVFRTEYDKNRPLIKNEDAENTMKVLISEREKFYEDCADIKVSTDDYDATKISKMIIKKYENNNSKA